MSEQITKRQHYVPRFYLEAWANEGFIWALHNRKDIINPNIENIMVEKFGYDLTNVTPDDLLTAHMLMVYSQKNPQVKKILENIIEGFHLYAFLNIYTPQEDMTNNLEKIGKIFLENLYNDFEGKASIALERIYKGDNSFLQDVNDKDFWAIVNFLGIQNGRTKVVRNGMKEKINTHQGFFHITDECVNMMGFLGGVAFACNMVGSMNIGEYKCLLLQNNTTTNFVTSDQPVINLLAEAQADKPPERMELYCPISPKMALILTDNREYSTVCSLEKVEYLNQRIIEFHSEWLVAKDKDSLKKCIDFDGMEG